MSLWYFAPPLAIVLFFATSLVYWFVVAVGFAAVAESLGSRWWSATGVVARVTGAALLILLMLVPVAGMLVVVALNFVSLGAGMGAFLWRRSQQVGQK